MGNRKVDPQTSSISAGNDPTRQQGALRAPLYESSTFVFRSAEEGRRYFEVVYGGAEPGPGEDIGYSYSRLDAPNLRVAEARLAAWEECDDALVFNSGTAAMATIFLRHLRPGDVMLYSTPIYGGTASLLRGLMGDMGVTAIAYGPEHTADDLERLLEGRKPAMVFVETPANPTNAVFDLEMLAGVAKRHGAVSVCDNTFLSPVWQRPVRHGIDLVAHSATKYLGGHSDLTAGAVMGPSELIQPLRKLRYQIGTTAQPWTAWLLTRSLETLQVRVERQTENATRIAAFLSDHPKVERVSHLSLLQPGDPGYDAYKRQAAGPGAMVTFDVAGGEEECFRFLDALRLIRHAVSLGGTESIVSQPWNASHSNIPPEERLALGIKPGTVRMSVGLEAAGDLIADLSAALDAA